MKKENYMKGMLSFLTEKKVVIELCNRAECTRNTVYKTFENEGPEQLSGKQLTVYQEAVKLINEIKNLPAPKDVLGK